LHEKGTLAGIVLCIKLIRQVAAEISKVFCFQSPGFPVPEACLFPVNRKQHNLRKKTALVSLQKPGLPQKSQLTFKPP
jgi:hypothetical protein